VWLKGQPLTGAATDAVQDEVFSTEHALGAGQAAATGVV